jgi:hypothetical protein
MSGSQQRGWKTVPPSVRVGTYVLGTAAIVAIVIVGVATAVALRMDFATHRRHLASIRISDASCPGVEAMHYAASDLREAYPLVGSSWMDARGHVRQWPVLRDSLARSSDALRSAIDLASPSLPRRVRHYLSVTRADLDAARPHLLLARNSVDFFIRTNQLYSDGQEAFGYASDLIGNRCAVPLGS